MKTQSALFALLAVGAFLSGPASAQTSQTLNLHDAEQIAIQNHPRIQAAVNLAAAAQAQVTQARSAYYPVAYGSLTGADAENNSRLAAGNLNSPRVFDKYSNGLTVEQLVTDFGRTHELVKSSNQHAKAQQENIVTTREDVLLQVDRGYFAVLRAQAVLTVAEQTVKARQLVSDQVTELEKNKIRSGLDVSFANVDLAQGQLLLIQAQNDLQASFAQLSAALGYADERTFHLAEEPLPPTPPADVTVLIQQALRDRPELIGQRFDVRSAQNYATAERDLWFPTISAVGAAGLTPVVGEGGLSPSTQSTLAPRYAAAGFNVNIPIFNGHLFGALRTEATQQAQAQNQYLRDLQDRIVRDVRTAWLNANSAFQRLSVTDQFLNQANQSLDLAQSRYKLGLSSIIELSQAQLNQTQAQIEQASAKYDYETQISALNYQLGALH
ncbi:MAG TPA: TolC family protein [Candidatus Acidoferrales bacterium]|nr:TolC family protein [Candidatus Acidoferrales bacterium]